MRTSASGCIGPSTRRQVGTTTRKVKKLGRFERVGHRVTWDLVITSAATRDLGRPSRSASKRATKTGIDSYMRAKSIRSTESAYPRQRPNSCSRSALLRALQVPDVAIRCCVGGQAVLRRASQRRIPLLRSTFAPHVSTDETVAATQVRLN